MNLYTSDRNLDIKLPIYSLGEEIFNSVSHGVGALLSVAGLVLMVIKATGVLSKLSVLIFGFTMLVLYSMSCIYHALPSKVEGKKVFRVIDHISVYLLVYGTYIPIALIGVKSEIGYTMFGVVSIVTIIGIILSSIKIDKFQALEVFCHLVNGWGVIVLIPWLLRSMGKMGVIYAVIGGVFYSLGAILYGAGAKVKYMHSVFHVFCLFGTLFHFLAIYLYLI